MSAKIELKKVEAEFVANCKKYGNNADFDYEVKCVQALAKNGVILNGNWDQIREAFLDISIFGLSINRKNQYACLTILNQKVTYLPEYKGLIYVMTTQLNVNRVIADTVRENDKFTWRANPEGLEFSHEPHLKGSAGDMYAAYAYAVMNDGSIVHVRPMTKEEITAIKSKAGKSSYSPWNGPQESEMWIKTMVKRLWKYIPKTAQYDNLAALIDKDNRAQSPELGQSTNKLSQIKVA